MMLTNFLPGGGNGTYTFYAVATDVVGKYTVMGPATVYIDNAHAVKPFGAIDAPVPGGTASGSSYTNAGWALTPPPNTIPTTGATLNVWVDGVPKGHPTYNQYRSDIASLFPGYNNNTGAGGYLKFNTTPYANGLHTILWTATDNAGNADGIGSRYFKINNSRSGSFSGSGLSPNIAVLKPINCTLAQIEAMPSRKSAPLRVKKGFDLDALPSDLPYSGNDSEHIVIKELDRVEIQLSDAPKGNAFEGYLMSGKRLLKLPVGSTLNRETGVFSWTPGPGHFGKYRLVFVQAGPDGQMSKKDVIVEIAPKY
jgi:hypothetical protein